MSKLILIATVLVVLGATAVYGYNIMTLGSDSDDWLPICVKGQVVYRANLANKAMAVNALTEDGKPVTCEVN